MHFLNPADHLPDLVTSAHCFYIPWISDVIDKIDKIIVAFLYKAIVYKEM
jgi:hypothetical protein